MRLRLRLRLRGMRGWRVAAVLLATPILAAGTCTEDTSSGPTTTVDPALVEADKTRAQAAVLTPADLPGWEVDSDDDGEEDNEGEPTPPECEEVDEASERGLTADATSSDFTHDNQLLMHHVNLHVDEETARQALDAQLGDDVRDCLENGFERVAREQMVQDIAQEAGVTPEAVAVDITVGSLSVGEVGDQRGGWSVRVRMTVAGLAVDFFFDMILVRVGRAVVGFQFLTFLAPVSEGRDAVFETGVAKARNALAT